MESPSEKIIIRDLENEMRNSYLDYSMSVIVGRALPDVRDGLKPVHRRILYTMYQNGLYPEKPYRKCADTVGSVLGSFHPHGDASVYDALVRLAQDFSMRYPLVDGHGNFGSVDGDPPAAYRYTEAKMSKISMHMLDDIDKNTVDFVPNYDDRLKEPTALPCRFPNLLVNGSTGIAVGMATNIPPHNMGETIDAMCMVIDNPDCSVEEIMGVLKGPDFPTGGIIMGVSGIRAAYATGRGKITLRGKAEIEEKPSGGFRIVITEIPYQVNKAMMIQDIAALHKEKRIEGITALRDESDREGMRVVVELRKDANPQVVLNQLYSYTQLQIGYGIIMLAVANGEPKILPVKEVLSQYIRFQESVITRRTRYDLEKALERAHILEGLIIAIDNIDEVIRLIRASKEVSEAKIALMERFTLDDVQAQAIVQMRLGQLTGLEMDKTLSELRELQAKISDLQDILSNRSRILSIIKDEAMVIKEKYNDPRRTEITNVAGEVDVEALIPEENCIVTLTKMGYIKRQPTAVYRAQHRGGRGVSGMAQREDDYVDKIFTVSSHDYLTFYTTAGKAYTVKGYDIAESGRGGKGLNVANLLQVEGDEKISAMICTRNFEDKENESRVVTMVTRKGIIKRTKLSEFANMRKRGLIAVELDEGDELAWVELTDGNQEIFLETRKGVGIRFPEEEVRTTGRSSRGVKAITLDEDDYVVGMVLVDESKTILSVTEKGFGKRTEFEQFRGQHRGGKGVTAHKITDKTGLVSGCVAVKEDDDLMLISRTGIIIRMAADSVSVIGRAGQGVTVMRLDEGNSLITVTPVEKEPEEDEPVAEEGTDEGTDETADGDGTGVNLKLTVADGDVQVVETEGKDLVEALEKAEEALE